MTRDLTSSMRIIFFAMLLVAVLFFSLSFTSANTLNQTIILDFNSSGYNFVNLTQQHITLGEPVLWKLLLQNDSDLLDFYYETSPVLLLQNYAETPTTWYMNYTFYTNFSGTYKSIPFQFAVSSKKDIVLSPNLTYTADADGQLHFVLPELHSFKTISFRGKRLPNLSALASTFFQTSQGIFFVDSQGCSVSDLSLVNNTQLFFELSNFSLRSNKSLTFAITFPKQINKSTVFYIRSSLTEEPIYLPYTYNKSSMTIYFDLHTLQKIFSSFQQGKLAVHSDILWEFDSQNVLFNLSTDKGSYVLGEPVQLLITPSNATSFFYLFNPQGEVRLLDTSSFLPQQVGNYTIEASLYYGNESEDISTSFSVHRKNSFGIDVSSNTSSGLFKVHVDKGTVQNFSIDDKLHARLVINNITAGSSRVVTLTLPVALPEGVHNYIWMKTNSGSYKQIPFEISKNRTQLRLFLQDGMLDADETSDGVLHVSFDLFLSPRTANIHLGQSKENANISIFSQLKQTNPTKGFQTQSIQELSSLQLITNKGQLGDLNIVRLNNIPIPPPNKNIVMDLLKFSIVNLTAGDSITLTLQSSYLPQALSLQKFNPNTVEWYSFPVKRLDDKTIQLTLVDGGYGDDDGLVNGIIEDDLGITNNWWNESWSFRQIINVTNNHNSSNISNYAIKLSLNSTNVGLHFNWSDTALLFSQYNGNTQSETGLDYWIEHWNVSSQTADVWVELDTLVGNETDVGFGQGITPVFMYYDSNGKATSSNGTATFLFFDDFNDGNLETTSTWMTDVSSQITEANGYLRLSGSWNGGGGYLSSIRQFTEPIVVDGSWRMGQYGAGEDTDLSVCFMPTNSTEWWSNSGVCTIYDGSGGGNSQEKGLKVFSTQSNGGDIQSTDWQGFEIRYNSTEIGFYDTFTDQTLSDTGSMLTNYYLNLAADTDSGTRYGDVDYIFVRPYIVNSPTVSLGGYEHEGILNQTIDLPINQSTYNRYNGFLFNGTTKCVRGNCENVTVTAQYLGSNLPEKSFKKTTFEDFQLNNGTTNISIKLTGSLDLLTQGGNSWWDSNWPYRKQLNITNTVANASNYAVKLNLDNTTLADNFNWSDKTQGLRFVYYNQTSLEETKTSYFIENWSTSSQKMTVYVLLPFLGNVTDEIIYVYYGNDVASQEQNPEDVFELFINFSDYTLEPLSGQDAQSGSSIATIINDTSLELAGNAWKEIDTSVNIIGDGSQILELQMKVNSPGEIYGVYFDARNAGPNAARSYEFDGSQSWGLTPDVTYTNTPNWQLVSAVLNDFSSNNEWMGFAADEDASANANVTYKNVRVRKYLTPEPTLGSVKSEEQLNYSLSGEYYSNILDVGSSSVSYENISWQSINNSNTSINVFSRSSADNSTWSSWFEESNGEAPQVSAQRYYQNKIELTTTNIQQTPQLNEITLKYKSLSLTWSDISSSSSTFTGLNYSLGTLNSQNLTSHINITATPFSQGEYLVRLKAASSNNDVSKAYSSQRNISIYLQPSFASFTADDLVLALGDTTTLRGTLVDEASSGLSGYNVSVYDETGNGTRQFIGSTITNSQGKFTLEYAPASDYGLGTHTLNVSYNSSVESFIRFANKTKTITLSSKPEINSVIISNPQIGYGYNTSIYANITDSVGLQDVYINISGDNGTNYYEKMNLEGGSNYSYYFNDSWHLESYSFVIYATNTDGIKTISSSRNFEVVSSISMKFKTEFDDYENNKVVFVNGSDADLYQNWGFRAPLTISSTGDLTNQQVKISLDSDNFDFSLANENGSDIRFTYYNQSSKSETELAYWIEFYNSTSERASIWIKLNSINTTNQTIYMYYGNENAVDAQNGSGVFLFFENFETFSGWNTYNSGVLSQSSLRAATGTYSGYKTNNNDPNGGYKNFDTALGTDIISEFRINRNSAYSGGSRDRVGLFSVGNGGYGWAFTSTNGKVAIETRNSGMTGSDKATASGTLATDQWVDGTLEILSDGTINAKRVIQGITDAEVSWSDSTYTSFDRFYIAGGYDYWVDDIRIRKYTSETIFEDFGTSQAVKNGITNQLGIKSKGYLRMLTQYWNGTTWKNEVPTVIDQQLIDLDNFAYEDISNLWEIENGWNTSSYDPGTYRVYAILEDINRNALKNSDGSTIEYYYNFTIKKPKLVVSELLHEHENDYSLNEYETKGKIDWINVSVQTINNTAYGANVTLSMLDNNLNPVNFGPQAETKLCGDLLLGQICQNTWDNSSQGYSIPEDANSGTYDFFWNVSMMSNNGPVYENKSNSIIIHHMPANLTVTLDETRLFKPNTTIVHFNLTNPWSRNISLITATINCPQINNFSCKSKSSGNLTESLTTLESGATHSFNFSIEINSTVASNNYNINLTLNYTNPATENISWNQIGNTILEVREKGVLEITDLSHPLNATRGQNYEFKSSVNNTGDINALLSYLNYTLPTDWVVALGQKEQTFSIISPSEIKYNNLTSSISINSYLGEQTVEIKSGASDGRIDFINYVVKVFAPTSQIASKNKSFIDRGETIQLQSTLRYDNGSVIPNQNISFYDQLTSQYLGWSLTDETGTAYFDYYINLTQALGLHTISTNYSENNLIYTRLSSNTTTIDVHEKPVISSFELTPQISGYGENIQFNATISDSDDIDITLLKITYPDSSLHEFEMNFVPPFDYNYLFNDTWQIGTYQVELYANDTLGSYNVNYTNFTINASLSASIDTLNNSYGPNEYVNLTEPTIPWWNMNFNKNKKITVTNLGLAQNNYSLKLLVDTQNISVQDDCGDIRFVSYNTSTKSFTELPYYNETVCNTSGTTTFWVKLNLTTGVNDVYIYYDTSDIKTSTATTPENIFIFYDDFETFSGWTTHNGGVVSQDLSQAKNGIYSAHKTTNSDPNGAYKDLGITLGRNIILEAWIQRNSGYSGGGTDRIGLINDSGDGYGFAFTQSSNSLVVDERSAYTGATSNTQTVTGRMDEWIYTKHEILSSGNLIRNSVYYNGVLEGTTSKSDTSVNSFTRAYIFGGYDYWVDDMRVRYYANTTVSFGNESTPGSQIINNLNIPTKGYLYMSIERNDSGWQHVSTIINDVSLRTINALHLNLKTIYDTNPWNTQNSQAGTYRVYVELKDDLGNIIKSYNGEELTAFAKFNITAAATILNVSTIRVYDISSALPSNRKTYTNELVKEGANTTFTLTNSSEYRFEIDVKNIGSSTWTINESNIIYDGIKNFGVNVSEIWYSNKTLIVNRRTDFANTPGSYLNLVNWNSTQYGGELAAGSTMTFFVIVYVNETQDRQVKFKINSTDYLYADYSTIKVLISDLQAPKLYNDIYNVSSKELLRGDSLIIYSRWDESIQNATARYSTTSPIIFTTKTNLSAQNLQNWTNFTLESLSTWNLGNHTAKIFATDLAGNENDTLPYLTYTLFGDADISESSLNDTTLLQGGSTKITCKVVDLTKSNQAIPSYDVIFTNQTDSIGTNQTDSSGYASYVYTDNSLGTENISCIIKENQTTYYKTNTNISSIELTTKEFQAPTYSSISGPSKANKGDLVLLSTLWQDNYILDIATLEINISGNESPLTLSGSNYWANFTYQIPTTLTPGNISWKQYANDTFSNMNETSSQIMTVYGWSKIASSTLSPASMQETNTTKMSCTISDANDTTLLQNYPVNFYYKNQSDSTYTYLGQNNTLASGISSYSFVINSAGTYDVKCNISDQGLYNDSFQNYQIKELNVVSGSDIYPPKIIGSNYTINTTSIQVGECILISGLWDESINYSYIKYNNSPSSFSIKNISEPYTANWTNGTLCTNFSWTLGNYNFKLVATDQNGNTNSSLAEFSVLVQGTSNLTYIQPKGSTQRQLLTVRCDVKDVHTGIGIENYPVTFYDSDLGFSIGSNTTDSLGKAEITYDYSSQPVGPDDISCTFESEQSLYYVAQTPLSQEETISFVANMTINIIQPENATIFHRSDTENLKASVMDENNNLVSGSTVIWSNSSKTNLATGNETTWQVPNNYLLGLQSLFVNATKQYMNFANDSTNIYVYGYSKVLLQSPTTGVYGDNTLLNVTCLVSDATTNGSLANYEVNITRNGTLVRSGTTNASGQLQYQVNTNTLTEGGYEFMCEIGNDASKYYTKTNPYMSTVFISVDKTAPQIHYTSSNDFTGNYYRNWIFVNVSATDSHLDNVWLNWSGFNYSFTHVQGNNYWRNMSFLSEGSYTFNAIANDTLGLTNTTSLQSVLVDLNNPIIDILLPENLSYTNQTTTSLNYTVSDLSLDSCWYTLNDGANQTLVSCSNTTVTGLLEGENNISVYANDSVSHQSSKRVIITRDITNPLLGVQVPTNAITYNFTSVNLNYTASDENAISSCWYILDENQKQTISNCLNTTLEGLTNDWHNLTVGVTDLAGNSKTSSLTFNVSYFELVATPIYPYNNSVLTSNTSYVNVSTNIDATQCNYTLDETTTASTSTTNNRAWSANVTNMLEGMHNISFSCTDGTNISVTNFYYFTVDTIGPQISFVEPTPHDASGVDTNWVLINVSLNEQADTTLLEWMNASGAYNFTMIDTGSHTNYYYNVSSLADATYRYRIFTNDSYGNPTTSATRTVIVSVLAPVITIHYPFDAQTYNQTVFDLNVSASKKIDSWYFLLNGENFSFTPNTSIVGNFGLNTLNVFGKDTTGKIGNKSIHFTVNTTFWTDRFGGFTGMLAAENAKVGDNLGIDFCWPVLQQAVLPQNIPANCWHYRKPMNISTTGTLSTYQVLLDLNLSTEYAQGKVAQNCSDLRFSYANGTDSSDALISYWVESCNVSGSTLVWLKVPYINDSTILYMYYGNNKTSSSENASAVFTFFEDFDNLTSANWGENVNNWISNATSAYPNVSGTSSRLIANTSYSNSYGVELRIKGNSSSGSAGYLGLGNLATGKTFNFYLDPQNNRINLNNGANNYYTIDSSSYQHYSFIMDYLNDNYTLTTNHESLPVIQLNSAAGGSRTNANLYSYYVHGLDIDYFALRKYDPNHPTISELGSEETPLVNASVQSILLAPHPIAKWDVLTVSGTKPPGTDLRFRLLNSTNESICGNLSLEQVSSGYSVCVLTNETLYLEAEVLTSALQTTPGIYNWTINWSETLHDVTAPTVTIDVPTPESEYNQSQEILIRVNVTDDVAVDYVEANVSWKGTQSEIMSLVQEDTTDFYSANFTNTSFLGSYLVQIFANDSSGNQNATESVSFSVNQTNDLLIRNITFSSESVEGAQSQVYVTVLNNGSADASDLVVELNISLWNGTKQWNETLTESGVTLLAGNTSTITFNWTNKIGTYLFDAYVDSAHVFAEFNETNNALQNNKTISSWEIIYGQYNYTLILANIINNSFTDWMPLISSGNLLYSDADAYFMPSDLEALNGTDDFKELDAALGLSGFSDSVSALFDKNNDGVADQTSTFVIAGRAITDVPIVNSTNNSNFITGILWDSADGVSYNGISSQDIVFVTRLNDTHVGKYGTYDFEVRLPSSLTKIRGFVNSVKRLDELN